MYSWNLDVESFKNCDTQHYQTVNIVFRESMDVQLVVKLAGSSFATKQFNSYLLDKTSTFG